jgi:uncharacterized protein (TIRG00374 family)
MPQGLKRRIGLWAPRLLGLLLLVVLLARLELDLVWNAIQGADMGLVAVSVLAVMPLILIKTIRWRGILRAQDVQFPTWPAFLSYFGSLFVGFLTPGRLGEFVKALHVSRDCGVSTAQAFSGVLVDRLFDLYALLAVGSAALLSLAAADLGNSLLVVVGVLFLFTVPVLLFLDERAFGMMQALGQRMGRLGRRVFREEGWLWEMRNGIRRLKLGGLAAGAVLTALAYTLYFGQCYLLALALALPVGFVRISFAVALGSLVTLLPISISGLGTREAAIIAYLGTVGVAEESALTFSLLVFVTFYIAGGLMGAVAWWVKPVEIPHLLQRGSAASDLDR